MVGVRRGMGGERGRGKGWWELVRRGMGGWVKEGGGSGERRGMGGWVKEGGGSGES